MAALSRYRSPFSFTGTGGARRCCCRGTKSGLLSPASVSAFDFSARSFSVLDDALSPHAERFGAALPRTVLEEELWDDDAAGREASRERKAF